MQKIIYTLYIYIYTFDVFVYKHIYVDTLSFSRYVCVTCACVCAGVHIVGFICNSYIHTYYDATHGLPDIYVRVYLHICTYNII